MIGFSAFLRLLLATFAGIGTAELADRVLPGKVANYEPVSPGLVPGKKLAIFVLCMVAGGLAWNFINRRFHILTRRHSSRRKKSKR